MLINSTRLPTDLALTQVWRVEEYKWSVAGESWRNFSSHNRTTSTSNYKYAGAGGSKSSRSWMAMTGDISHQAVANANRTVLVTPARTESEMRMIKKFKSVKTTTTAAPSNIYGQVCVDVPNSIIPPEVWLPAIRREWTEEEYNNLKTNLQVEVEVIKLTQGCWVSGRSFVFPNITYYQDKAPFHPTGGHFKDGLLTTKEGKVLPCRIKSPRERRQAQAQEQP